MFITALCFIFLISYDGGRPRVYRWNKSYLSFKILRFFNYYLLHYFNNLVQKEITLHHKQGDHKDIIKATLN